MTIVSTSSNQSLSQLAPEKIELLKRTICKGATNDELELFIHACNRTCLDPFMRQIYFVKMGGQVTIQTGIDGYRLIAERSGRYMPGKESTFTYDKNGELFSATSYVKKLAQDGTWHEIAATAIMSEYRGKGPMWASKPHIMLSKCSESICLRRAFPADLSGLYTKEEMEQADNEATEQPTGAPPVEIITSEEAQEIENLIGSDDKEYRDNLLKFFSSQMKVSPPLANFFGLHRKYYDACMKSVKKKAESRKKIESEEEIPF